MRAGDWQWGTSIQQEIMPRVSAEFGYQHRWLLNFTATDNRAVGSSDYDRFSVIIPSDPRLPNGGGGQLDDIFNITQAASARATDNFVTLADRFGEQKQVTDSFSLNVTARPRFGLTMQGGFNYALTNTNSCEIRAALPESGSVDPWCDHEHVAAAGDGARQLHSAEDRRPAGDDVPQRTGPAAGGQLHRERRPIRRWDAPSPV